MNLKERLLKKYGKNQPIFINEVRFSGLSDSYVRSEITRMVKRGEIKRYMKGVYYFPSGKFKLSPLKICGGKYLRRNGQASGFYSGANLRNLLGLSTQVPFITEITTNAVTRNRRVRIGVYRFVLLPPRVKITNRNLSALQLLNVIESTALASFERDVIQELLDFIRRKRVTKSVVSNIIGAYPKDTLPKLQKTGLFDALA